MRAARQEELSIPTRHQGGAWTRTSYDTILPTSDLPPFGAELSQDDMYVRLRWAKGVIVDAQVSDWASLPSTTEPTYAVVGAQHQAQFDRIRHSSGSGMDRRAVALRAGEVTMVGYAPGGSFLRFLDETGETAPYDSEAEEMYLGTALLTGAGVQVDAVVLGQLYSDSDRYEPIFEAWPTKVLKMAPALPENSTRVL